MDSVLHEFYSPQNTKNTSVLPSLGEIKCGRTIITIFGILIGFTCSVILLLKDRKCLSNVGIVLVVFMALFIVFSVMFIIMSLLLLLATLDDNLDLVSRYTWHSMLYLCLQLLLALSIPAVLVIDERPITPLILTWLCIVLIVGLGWTHFVAVVDSYRMELVNGLSM